MTLKAYGASESIIVDMTLRREGQEIMTKATITRMWIAGLIVLVAGLLVGGISVGLMLAFGGTFTPAATGNGQEFVPRFDGFFWTTVGFIVVGFTIAVIGSIIQLSAWIGALVNTYQLEDKAWFIGLLIGGLLGLGSGIIGFAAMVAYIVAGPDGMRAQAPQTPMFTPAPAPYPPAPPAAQPVPEQPPLVHAS